MKVTICIPAYNASHTIAETLDSLLTQSFHDFEIIVSDNYSTDNTREVVQGYRDRGVQLVTCPLLPVKTGSPLDNCLSSVQNWNSLVELGVGEYVGIYHADDVYDRHIIQRQMEIFDRHSKCSAVLPTCKSFRSKVNESFGSECLHSSKVNERLFNQLDLVKEMLRRGHFMSTSGAMLRRESWITAGRVDAVQFEHACDSEFWIRLAGVGLVAVIPDALVHYRIHLGQDSQNGVALYRERPLPIVGVLKNVVSRVEIKASLEKEDLAHLAATYLDEDLRISLNLFDDGRSLEAAIVLQRLPELRVDLIRTLWKDHRRLRLGRLFIGKLLALACRCGIGNLLAKKIKKSVFGFSLRNEI